MERLQKIFTRTNGRCHLTGQPLVFSNYGKANVQGGWEIEHSIPRSLGGTDHLNNLYAASISANRAKGNGSTRTVRAQHGLTRAPYSPQRIEQIQEKNAWEGLLVGGLLGLVLGPIGVGIGAAFGAAIGSDQKVK